MLSLAIVDDIGAIVVIAIFYTGGLAWSPLAIAVGLLVVIAVLHRVGVVWWPVHVLLGLGVWLATYASGVHATIAGVAVGLLMPSRPVRETVSAAERLAHSLHPWTSYVVVPLFALANAGVPLSRAALAAAVGSPVTGGVVLGLVVGKLVGVSGAAWLALRLGIGALPEAVTSRQLLALSAVAGVGFTVSLFIAGLAYPTAELEDQARVGILAGSLLAALIGGRAPAGQPAGPTTVRRRPDPAGCLTNPQRSETASPAVLVAAPATADRKAGCTPPSTTPSKARSSRAPTDQATSRPYSTTAMISGARTSWTAGRSSPSHQAATSVPVNVSSAQRAILARRSRLSAPTLSGTIPSTRGATASATSSGTIPSSSSGNAVHGARVVARTTSHRCAGRPVLAHTGGRSPCLKAASGTHTLAMNTSVSAVVTRPNTTSPSQSRMWRPSRCVVAPGRKLILVTTEAWLAVAASGWWYRPAGSRPTCPKAARPPPAVTSPRLPCWIAIQRIGQSVVVVRLGPAAGRIQ